MQDMKLNLALALHLPAPTGNAGEPSKWNVDLLRIATAWLNRRQAGMADDLLIVGSGFTSEDELVGYLKPYGLAGARLETLDAHIGDMYLEEEIGVAVKRWKGQVHEGSIPTVHLNGFIDDSAYPTDGFWWAGVEASSIEKDEDLTALACLIPDSIHPQAGTWTAILMDRLGHRSNGEECSDYEASITLLVLAYWLNGFDAASNNGFFNFSATEGFDATDLDRLRVGFEAGQLHQAKAGECAEWLDVSNEGFDADCLIACLAVRVDDLRNELSKAFGGDSALFWSLYSSIWPKYSLQMHEAMDHLLNLKTIEAGEIDRAWQFVQHGWVDLE